MPDPPMSTASTLVESQDEKDGWKYQGSAGFCNALRKFRNRLTQKEVESFKITSIEDVLESIRIVQSQQDPQKGLMNMTRLRGFLEAMKELGQIIEVFLNTSDAVAFVWGPVKFLLLVASTWTQSLDTLLDAYEQIGETVPLLMQYEALFRGNPHLLKVVEMIYEDILTFHQSALKFFADKTWKQLFKSAWKTFDTKFKHIIAGLQRHHQLLKSQVDVIHLTQYEIHRTRAQENLDQIQKKALENALATTRQWLGGGQATVYHEHACSARLNSPLSGKWILKHEKISTWLSEDCPDRPVVWMHGIPGAGKTVLASVIIQNCIDSESISVAYCYARHDDQEANTAVSVLKALLSQSITNDPDLIHHIHEHCVKSHEPSLASLGNAERLLTLVCQRPGRRHFIIDGVDECNSEERKNLLTTLNRLVEKMESQDPGNIRILIVSQDESDIRKHMGAATHFSLRLQDNETDIESYVASKCSDIREKFELAEEQATYIRQMTCHKAKGMFLYATLVMENLLSQPNQEFLIFEIKAHRFPEGLKQAYQRILHRIKSISSDSEWQVAHKLLGWMVCTKRPLKWREMQGAISFDQGRDEVNFDALKLRTHIKDICGSLLLVLPGDRVVLVHSTAAQYIMDSGYVRSDLVECRMTSLCLRYLSMSCFTEFDELQLQAFAMDGYFAFQDYAFAKWYHHLRSVVDHISAPLLHDATENSDTDLSDALFELCEASDEFKVMFFSAETETNNQMSFSGTNLELPQKVWELFADQEIEDWQAFETLWIYATQQQLKDLESRNKVSPELLANALERSRKTIEDLTIKRKGRSKEEAKLEEYYGKNRFKCPKLTCFYFHEGFRTDGERKSHINKHDRPFQCLFADCEAAEFGYSSKKDLDKHTRATHPEFEDQANLFPEPPTKKPIEFKHKCVICGKGFTRAQILKSHQLTHSGQKPHACSHCGKAFTRVNDKNRHERTLHENRIH